MNRLKYRKIKGALALFFCSCATLFGLFWLAYILSDVLVRGYSSLNPNLFFNDPVPPGEAHGGLRNAFVGQLLIVFYATLIGVPIGVLAGTFNAEYARGTRLAKIISTVGDIMVSVPSIIIGTFIYAIIVKPVGHFNG